jgi:hypothetical protein
MENCSCRSAGYMSLHCRKGTSFVGWLRSNVMKMLMDSVYDAKQKVYKDKYYWTHND